MIRITKWKLIILFIYSCTTIPVFMFLLSLFFLWQPSPVGEGVFAEKNLHVALNMAGVGFLLGIILWLSYYLPYRKRDLNKTKS